ncbi:hypothetical protein AGDE_02216 [Angomonas deanei]|uniref:Transmembrane protein n=1 Tax=Angomonas deanei TaxID=59799 RepID=A0A7G2CP43_9TRYP|nr:hypothetical protein AGDE_02216 [Angomonas deanei]CAD2221626.1 hypothetical protein, conserved [Angomonas deanei]|eukprot:EPY41708.1 hypothetical protein AGDE_02216 [Angomonas deanei]
MKSRDVFVSFGEEDSPTIENAGASFEVVNPPGEEDTALSEATPSSAYEEVICKQLRELLERCQSSWGDTLVMFRSLFFSFVFAQNWAVLVTCAMLAIACILQPISSTIVCTCLFIVLSASCVLLQGYIIWERVTEVKFRTADVINAVLIRWSKRIVEMRNKPSQNNSERRKVFLETFSHLPASAFRMFAVVDQRTLRLKLILKSLVVKRSKRLDEVTLSVRRYMEPKSICKLVDVMGITLESYAIVLRPLVDRARPPRLPNLLMSGKRFVEEEATTDESDGERESRTALRGGNSISVSHHMEYFVFRVFLLFWIVAMCFTIAAGILYYFVAGAPLGEGVFRDPSVALLGLLPLNATVVNRFLVLYANVYLDKLFHYIVCKKLHDVDDRLPRFSMWSALTTMFRVFFHRQPENGSRNPMVFSGSLVDGFGMASVVAMLDQTGIVTDMVLLPVQVLCLKGRQPTNTTLQSSSSSSSSDEEAAEDSLPVLPPEGNTDDAPAVGEEPANIHTDPGEENAANTFFTGVSQVTAEAARERKKT